MTLRHVLTLAHHFILKTGIFVALALSASIAFAQANNTLFDYADTYFYPINNNDQIPWGIVTDITQDNEGFMWIGTQKGIMRFDGYQFEHYSPDPENPNSLSGSWVTDISEVTPGELWVSTETGISILNKQSNSFTRLEDIITNPVIPMLNEASSVFVDDREVWILARHRLFRFNLDDRSVIDLGAPQANGDQAAVNALAKDKNGRLWVGSGAGLYYLDQVENTFIKANKAHMSAIGDLLIDLNGNLWLSTRNEGLQFSRLQDGLVNNEVTIETLDSGRYRKTVQISDSHVWAMKFNDGIHVFDINKQSLQKKIRSDALVNHALISNDIRTAFKDKSGIVWVSNWGEGISLYNESNQHIRPFSIRSLEKQQSKFSNIIDILVDHDDTVWLLGGDNLFSVSKENNYALKTWPAVDKLVADNGSNAVYIATSRLLDNGENTVYILTDTGQILELNPKNEALKLVPNSENFDCHDANDILLDKKNQLWILCQRPAKLVRYNFNNSRFENIIEPHTPEMGLINALKLGPKGNIWIATQNKLLLVSDIYSAEPQISNIDFFAGIDVITTVFEDDNTMWIDSFSGLFRGKKSNAEQWEFESISKKMGLPADQFFGNMMLDEKGWLWGDEGGLDTKTLQLHPLRKGDGFNTGANWLGSYGKMADGTLLFGAFNQFAALRPQYYQPWSYRAPVVITKLQIDNQSLSETPSEIELAVDKKSFTVDFSLLDYSSPGTHRYAYQLVGYDEDWIYTGAENRRLNYTNLPSGNYTLKIKGASNNGDWSDLEVSLPIKQAASFFEGAIFNFALTILFSLFLWGVYLLKRRRHRIREQELSTLVQARTQELEQSLNNLHLTQEKLVDSEKQAILGRLVRGLSHELNTPLSIIKMGESMLSEKVMQVFQALSSVGRETIEQAIPGLNKTQTLIRNNLEKTIALVSHFKAADIEEGNEERQWLELHPHIGLLIKSQTQDVTVSGDQGLRILCHKGAITAVISELLSNANLHGGNDVHIQYQTVPVDGIDVSQVTDLNKDALECLEITVSDSGKGIPEDTLAKVFDPFFSASDSGVKPGLGLYIIENLVRFRMQGSISATSQDGLTSFTILFPVEAKYGEDGSQLKQSTSTPTQHEHVELH